jgi:ABC-type multidrug transport system fused ATPase/permease subunit
VPSSTVFTKSVLKTKKKSKLKLLFNFTRNIISNNPWLFLACSLLAIITAIINFNIGICFKNAFFVDEKTLSTEAIEAINKSKKEKIDIDEIKAIINQKVDESKDSQNKVREKIFDGLRERSSQKTFKKEEAVKLVEESSKDIFTTSVRRTNNFKFRFNLFGWELFKRNDLWIWEFIGRLLILILVVKSIFSLLHYYLMSYSYDSIERDLKKDLFHHFLRTKYANSTEVSRNLITQFASDLDSISYSVWFIPNRLIYIFASVLFLILFDFSFGSKGINWEFVMIIFGLFSFLMVIEFILFKRASKLGFAAKKRYEEDNKVIYERINNLEYIKAVSGEKYEEKKVGKQLDSTFQKNKKSLWWIVLFKAFPNYVIIPNIPTFFITLALTFTSKDENDPVFLVVNFHRYYITVSKLNSEINKLIDSLLTLEELSSNLNIVNENVKILNQTNAYPPTTTIRKAPFENGDIIFQNASFSYPKRPQQNILRNFSFRFEKGKVYGIAGKNGIGKSTITKTTLKLYELKEGQILINNRNIQEIDTPSLHQRICYQTNRPTFFRMSIAENVFYPHQYQAKDHWKLVEAAQQVGIYEFITKLPEEFDTELREGGTDLSEGQKQQITAMRMFINDYDIYILDEILSNVHPNLKDIILQNIFKQLKGKTVLVIDHHYKIFRYVDYTYQFTGEELIAKGKEEFVN